MDAELAPDLLDYLGTVRSTLDLVRIGTTVNRRFHTYFDCNLRCIDRSNRVERTGQR
jgi:hypothetical protein